MISNKKKKAFYIYFVRRQTLPISKVPVVKLQNVWEKFKNMPHWFCDPMVADPPLKSPGSAPGYDNFKLTERSTDDIEMCFLKRLFSQYTDNNGKHFKTF